MPRKGSIKDAWDKVRSKGNKFSKHKAHKRDKGYEPLNSNAMGTKFDIDTYQAYIREKMNR